MNQNSQIYKINLKLTYYSLLVLSIGAFTSITILALSHILILLPAIYFTYWHFREAKKMPLSQWALLGLCLTIILSALVNWNELLEPNKFFKFKYFLISFLGVFAYQEAFKSYIDLKKKKILLNLFLISTSIATIAGLIAMVTGYNYLLQKAITHGRASGLNGMIMTYSYGLSLFMILLTGLIINREKVKEYISTNFLVLVWIINFIGLYFSYARGAWLGFFLAVPFLFWKKSKKIFLAVSIICIVIFGLSVKFNSKAKNRFLNSTDSNQQRIAFYKAAFYAFLEKPLFGLGYNNFEPNVLSLKQKYNLEYKEQAGKAHNNFFEFLASTGIIGLSFLVLFHFFWAWEGLKIGFFGEINATFVISLAISGMVQHTLADGSNLFLIMGYYAIFTAVAYQKETFEENILEPELALN